MSTETSPRGPCPMNAFHQAAGGKYKMRVLWELKSGPKRYGELKRSAVIAAFGTPVTARVLSRELKELQQRGIISRSEEGGRVRKVEYSLTPLGETLIPVIERIVEWGLMARAVVR